MIAAAHVTLRVTPAEFSDIQTMIEQAQFVSARGESTLEYFELPLARRFGDRVPELKLVEQRQRVEVEIIVVDSI